MVEQHAADTLQPFLDQLREALTAVANGDPEPMKALCSHSDAISQCGFWGGVESGWAEVSERWDWVAAQFVPGPGVVTSDTAFLTVSGEMAYGVFIERWWGQFRSRSEPTEIMIRATLIFRREDGVWKAVHRHGDNAVAKAPPSQHHPALFTQVRGRGGVGGVLVREAARRFLLSFDVTDGWYIKVFSGELTHLSLLNQSQPPPSLSPGPGQDL